MPWCANKNLDTPGFVDSDANKVIRFVVPNLWMHWKGWSRFDDVCWASNYIIRQESLVVECSCIKSHCSPSRSSDSLRWSLRLCSIRDFSTYPSTEAVDVWLIDIREFVNFPLWVSWSHSVGTASSLYSGLVSTGESVLLCFISTFVMFQTDPSSVLYCGFGLVNVVS